MSRKKLKDRNKQAQKSDKTDTSLPAQRFGRLEIRVAESKELMLRCLQESGCTVSIAAYNAGIDRQTHYAWLNSDTEYVRAFAEIKEEMLDSIENVVWKILSHDAEKTCDRINAAKLMLSAKGKDRGYGSENRKVEHSGEINGVARVEFIARLPDNGRGPTPTD